MPELHRLGWRTLAFVFLATLAVYLLAAVRMLPFVEPPTGDQPHYLLQTISLAEDGDLDLRNNYTTAESYGQFSAPGRRREGFRGIPVGFPLEPEGHIVVRPSEDGDRWYPKHSPGLPALMLPGWTLGQAFALPLERLTSAGGGGWPGTVFQMAVFGAMLATQVFLLAWEVTGRTRVAFAIWAAISFSMPQLFLSLMIYPETVAGLGLIYTYRHLAIRPLPSGPWRLVLVGLVIGLLPWLNPRFVLLSGGLASMAAVVLWRGRRNSRRGLVIPATLIFLPPLVSALALRWFQVAVHGSALAVADQYEGFFVPTMIDGRLGADWQAFFVALAGLFVDRQYGLLVFAPVYALAIVGMVGLWRVPQYRWAVIGLGVVAAPYVLLTADFRVWWGGWSPPARYLAVLTPLLAAPLARSMLTLSRIRPYTVIFAALAGAGILAALVLLFQLGDSTVEQAIFGNPSRNPAMLRWLVLRYGVELPQILPATAPWFGDRRGVVPWTQIGGYFGLLAALVGLSVLLLPPSTGRSQAVRQSSATDPTRTVGAERTTPADEAARPPVDRDDTRQ